MHAGDIVLQLAVQFAHLLLGDAEIGPHLFGKHETGGQDQRQRDGRDQRELSVDGQQHHQHAGEGDEIGDHIRNDMGVEQLKIPGIIDHAGHEVAGLLVMKEAQVETFQLVVGLRAQVAHQIPGSLVSNVIAAKAEQNPQQIQSHQGKGQQQDGLHALRGDAPFHDARHGGEHLGGRQVDARQAQRGQDGNHIQLFVPHSLVAQPQKQLHSFLRIVAFATISFFVL